MTLPLAVREWMASHPVCHGLSAKQGLDLWNAEAQFEDLVEATFPDPAIYPMEFACEFAGRIKDPLVQGRFMEGEIVGRLVAEFVENEDYDTGSPRPYLERCPNERTRAQLLMLLMRDEEEI